MRSSPFKFLDPYTRNDRDAFFGREEEVAALHQMATQNRLVLVYGPSGTGKTSLVQCGLASRFDATDWYPLFIQRKSGRLPQKLEEALAASLGGEQQDSHPEAIEEIYARYLRPVYLIFDQLEELFILGKREEQEQFIHAIADILAARLPCQVLFILREEYLGSLYAFEKVIPSLLDRRLRVEPMSRSRVEEVIARSCQRFGIGLEDAEQNVQQITDNVSAGKSGIQLPYLQVYLEMLWRKWEVGNRESGIGNRESGIGIRDSEGEGGSPVQGGEPVRFTTESIQQLGPIEDVLGLFLEEQVPAIQAALEQGFEQAPPDTTRRVLNAFVTDQGTRRPVFFRREEGQVVLEGEAGKELAGIPAPVLTECLEALQRSRLLRFSDDAIEPAHDSLAAQIDAGRSNEERRRNEYHRQLRTSYELYQRTEEYLTPKQLALYQDELDQLGLDAELREFFDASSAFRKEEEEKKVKAAREEAEKEKRLRTEAETAQAQAQQARQQAEENAGIATAHATRAKGRTRIAGVLAVLAGVALVFAVQKCEETNSTNYELKETYANLNTSYQELAKEKETSRQRADELGVKNKQLDSTISQLEESQERIKMEQNNTQRALNSLEDYARQAMPVLRRDIDNLILHLNYDSALAQCKIAWNLNEGALEIERRFQEVAYFFTESHTYDKAEEALDYIGPRPAKPGDPGQRAAKLREAVKGIDFKYWRDTLEKRYYPEMVHVEGGTFEMGCDEEKLKKVFGEDQECPESEKKHTVRLKSYRIARTETTVWQYALYCAAKKRNFFKDDGYTPTWGWQGNHPVVNVSWYDALAYAEWLTAQQKQIGENLERVYKGLGEIGENPNNLDTLGINWNEMADWEANGYRLPTEAEWEYAARGGQPGMPNNYVFAGSDTADLVAVYGVGGGTWPVGRKRKNGLGLYDMSGNVWEWCWDYYNSYYYENSPLENPYGPDTQSGSRVLRGGSWDYNRYNLRSSNRISSDPRIRFNNLGFRLTQGY